MMGKYMSGYLFGFAGKLRRWDANGIVMSESIANLS